MKAQKDIGISGTEQMIFVTVGTHEQQFDRLIKEVDRLRKNGDIEEDVIAQIGYGTYEPKNCQWSRFYPYQEMCEYVDAARIVITHGGPSSFLAPLQRGKMPIVVPRQKRFGEHVNDHQVEFCRAVRDRLGNITLVEDMKDLCRAIKDRNVCMMPIAVNVTSNNERFNKNLEIIVNKIRTERMGHSD